MIERILPTSVGTTESFSRDPIDTLILTGMPSSQVENHGRLT